MSRVTIVHRTGFTYEAPSTASYNEARMLPRSTDSQTVLASHLEIVPSTAQHEYTDYWGTRVSTFEVLIPHSSLAVTATSVIDVHAGTPTDGNLSWAELAQESSASTELVELSLTTPHTAVPAELAERAAAIADQATTPHEAALLICREIHGALTYSPGSTGVHSTALEAWESRRGVCQDYAHLTLAALRSVGIPARYCSGYLNPKSDAAIGETVLGESHAWVEWFAGDWCGFDPTNVIEIGDRHVLVARGRDYTDVSPLRGVYAGGNTSEVFVKVEITRTA